jgi:hypothetical protein
MVAPAAQSVRRRQRGRSRYAAIRRWLHNWGHALDTTWFSETLRRLDAAQQFFAGAEEYPKFKRRRQSLVCDCPMRSNSASTKPTPD